MLITKLLLMHIIKEKLDLVLIYAKSSLKMILKLRYSSSKNLDLDNILSQN